MIQHPYRCLVMAALSLIASVSLTFAENVTLATNRVPAKTIVVPTTSGTALQAAAAELAGFLNRITTGTFVTGSFVPATGPNANTIVLAKASDVNLSDELPLANAKQNEHFLIAAANSGSNVIIAGTTEQAVVDAVYDWLERMGCRWFFPTAKWEVLPSNINLKWTTAASPLRTKNVTMGTKAMAMNIYHDELPDYKSRFIWFPYNIHTGANPPHSEWLQQWNEYVAWSKRNRNVEGTKIKIIQNYSAIVTWAKSQTASDPTATPPNTRWRNEYYSLINGVRGHADPNIQLYYQLCVSNTAVVQICKDYATSYLATNPQEISVSMEPNDGTYWCECSNCEAIQAISSGAMTDRVLHVANAVATHLGSSTATANKYVGMLAYGAHGAPPTAADGVHDQIYVAVSTGYLWHGYTFEQLLAEWGTRTPNVGVYDFMSVFTWDYGLPLRSDASDLSYIRDSLPAWHNLSNADNYNCQSTYSFGALGLGHYLGLKVLWDTGADVAALRQDFLTKCFGAASATMDDFYKHIDIGEGYRLSTDVMGRLFGYLDRAYSQTSDPAVIARLDDLAVWLRYCEMRRAYATIDTEDRQDAVEEALRFLWKIRATSMVDSLYAWRVEVVWDGYDGIRDFYWPLNTVTWPHVWSGTGQIYVSKAPGTMEMDFKVPMVPTGSLAPEGHPWKESGTFTHSEILDMVDNGIANNPLLAEEPRFFGSDMVPSGKPSATRGTLTGNRYGDFAFYLRTGSTGLLPTLQMSSGWSHSYGPLLYTLYTADGEIQVQQTGTIPNDKVTYNVVSATHSPYTNYLMICGDNRSGSRVSWPAGAIVSSVADGDYPFRADTSSYRYFYVPKGTQNVIAYVYSLTGTASFYNASGTLKYGQPALTGGTDITIPVAAGEDDTVWYVRNLKCTDFLFQNVPGLFAASPNELLIPKDALEDLLPSSTTASTRGTFVRMYKKNAFYIRGDATGVLPSFSISNGWNSSAYGNGEWTLYTENGKTALESGVIPPNQITYNVNFTTSSTNNTYLFVYDDKKGSSKVEWPAGKFVSIVADVKYPHTQSGGVTRRYFFVPKGTTTVNYKAKAILACNFYNAAGTLRHAQPAVNVAMEGGFVVPDGEDDQFWYATSFAATEFYFVNIRGLLGANRNEMLIPHWTFLD